MYIRDVVLYTDTKTIYADNNEANNNVISYDAYKQARCTSEALYEASDQWYSMISFFM